MLYARTVAVPLQRGALLAGLMFALHPVHTEAVAGVVGRAEVLSAVFFFAALLSYHRHVELRREGECGESGKGRARGSDPNGNVLLAKKKTSVTAHAHRPGHRETAFLGLTVALAALAMFSKEQGVTVLGVCFANDLLRRPGGMSGAKKRSLAALAASAAALLALRARAMGFSPPRFASADNPASAEDSAAARALTFLFLPALNFWLLLCPSRLSFDWSMDAVPVVRSVADARNLATLAFYSALGAAFATRVWPLLPGCRQAAASAVAGSRGGRSDRLAAACLSLMALPFLPASNLFFYVGFVVAERVLYIPSAGFCLLSGCGAATALSWARGRPAAARAAVAAILLCALLGGGLRTAIRNRDWADEEGLYRSGIQINPPKGKRLGEDNKGGRRGDVLKWRRRGGRPRGLFFCSVCGRRAFVICRERK